MSSKVNDVVNTGSIPDPNIQPVIPVAPALESLPTSNGPGSRPDLPPGPKSDNFDRENYDRDADPDFTPNSRLSGK